MKQIDLHVHSTCSDGTDSPAVLVDKAVDKGLAAFALTDHDTTKGVKEALLACENVNKTGHELEVIPGVEISTNYDNTEIHVVGLFIDYNDNELISYIEEQNEDAEEILFEKYKPLIVRFAKKIYKKSIFPLKPLLSLCLPVIIYAALP